MVLADNGCWRSPDIGYSCDRRLSMLGDSLHVQIHITYTLLQFVALVTHLAIGFGTCSGIHLAPRTFHSASADPQDTHMRADTLQCPGRRCLHGDHHRSEDTAYHTESLQDRHRILQDKWSESLKSTPPERRHPYQVTLKKSASSPLPIFHQDQPTPEPV